MRLAVLLLICMSTLSAHPLDSLTAKEYATVVRSLNKAGLTDVHSRYPLIRLQEHEKSQVLRLKSKSSQAQHAFVI